MSPNTIAELKKKVKGSTTDKDPMIKITRMLYDRAKPADILKKGYPPEKISKAIDDLNELEGKYTNSDSM